MICVASAGQQVSVENIAKPVSVCFKEKE